MKRAFFVITLSLMAIGCATVRLSNQQIVEQASHVNKSNGIDKTEAILLARKYAVENEGKNKLTERYRIEAGHIESFNKKDNIWVVDFSSRYGFFSKEGYQFTLQVWVNAETGEVKSMHICKY